DVRDHLSAPGPSYDVICLDVDNGPGWTVTERNTALYDDNGTWLVLERLSPNGVLSVWSAHDVPDYEQRLRRLAGDVRVLTVDVPRGEPDVIYVARRRPG